MNLLFALHIKAGFHRMLAGMNAVSNTNSETDNQTQ